MLGFLDTEAIREQNRDGRGGGSSDLSARQEPKDRPRPPRILLVTPLG